MQFKKFEIAEEKNVSKNGPVTFVASTATPDRYDDIVDQKGWDLRAFQRNPVVLFNHNPNQMPIGKGKAYLKDGALMIDVEFDKNDPDAQKIESKVRGGFINAVSVGFQPSETIPRSRLSAESPYYGKTGMYFPKSELLEVSIVTIPANNEATLAKNFQRTIGLTDVAKSLVFHKHIVSIQMLENGNYLVEFANAEEAAAEDSEEADYDKEEETGYDKEEEDKMKEEEEEEEKMEEEEEEEEKAFQSLLQELKNL